jgi:hypothetical protein
MNILQIPVLLSSRYSELRDLEVVEIRLIQYVGDFYQSINRNMVEK